MAELALTALHLGSDWDELMIAVVALGVIWLAVKLAGRQAVQPDEEDSAAGAEAIDANQPPVAPPSVS